MNIDLNINEILEEMNTHFPKETQICVQAIQIRKLKRMLDEVTPEDEGEIKYDYEYDDEDTILKVANQNG